MESFYSSALGEYFCGLPGVKCMCGTQNYTFKLNDPCGVEEVEILSKFRYFGLYV